MKLRRTILLLGWAAWVSSARLSRGEVSTASVYEVQGVLQTLDLEHRQATIAHGEIPGYMPAMTMSFDVRNAADLENLRPGDRLAFRLCVSATSAWIEQVRRTGETTPVFSPAATAHPRELGLGDLLPDIGLVNALGQPVHLKDFRGHALAITFVYARCPLPTYCPLLNRNFHAAQALLERLDAGEDWHFLSISLDPAHDTPDVLANFAKSWGADPRHWTFVTAPEAEVHELGRAVGLEFSDANGRISHNLRTVVLDAEGRIRQVYRGNNWTPQDLAAKMRNDAPTSACPGRAVSATDRPAAEHP